MGGLTGGTASHEQGLIHFFFIPTLLFYTSFLLSGVCFQLLVFESLSEMDRLWTLLRDGKMGVLCGKGLTCWLHVNMVTLLDSEYFGTIDPDIMISIVLSLIAIYLLLLRFSS